MTWALARFLLKMGAILAVGAWLCWRVAAVPRIAGLQHTIDSMTTAQVTASVNLIRQLDIAKEAKQSEIDTIQNAYNAALALAGTAAGNAARDGAAQRELYYRASEALGRCQGGGSADAASGGQQRPARAADPLVDILGRTDELAERCSIAFANLTVKAQALQDIVKADRAPAPPK